MEVARQLKLLKQALGWDNGISLDTYIKFEIIARSRKNSPALKHYYWHTSVVQLDRYGVATAASATICKFCGGIVSSGGEAKIRSHARMPAQHQLTGCQTSLLHFHNLPPSIHPTSSVIFITTPPVSQDPLFPSPLTYEVHAYFSTKPKRSFYF